MNTPITTLIPLDRIIEYSQSPAFQAWSAAQHAAEHAKRRRYRQKRARNHAHQAVENALAAGILPPASTQPCAYCENTAYIWHHHRGYTPKHHLDVISLCPDCYHRVHTTPLTN